MAEGTEERGRLLAVGDIHGCLGQLRRLMEQVRPQEQDRVVFLGDYIDRGSENKGVIDYLLDFARRFPRSVFLKGNHEAMLLDFLDGYGQNLYLLNGGDTTLESYAEGGRVRIPKAHLDFLAGLRLYFETEGFIFVHAGLRPGLRLAAQHERDMLWIRDEFLESNYDWGKTVVFGHTPRAEPLFTPTRIGLDTGAVFGRPLTCCDVETRRCWQAGPGLLAP